MHVVHSVGFGWFYLIGESTLGRYFSSPSSIGLSMEKEEHPPTPDQWSSLYVESPFLMHLYTCDTHKEQNMVLHYSDM